MKFIHSQSKRVRQDRAFTLIENLFAIVFFFILMGYSLRTSMAFYEQRKLRTAAIELSGYLQIARNVAASENGPCVIGLTNSTTGVFGPPNASDTTNACVAGRMQPSLNLRQISGSRNVRADVIPNSGTFPLTFTPEGTIRDGATVLISSTDVPIGGWCVNVLPPLATVRIGWRPSGSNTCNYAIEQ